MPAAMPLSLFDDEDKGLVQKSMFLGRLARGADLGALSKAETMLEYKRPMDAIRKETGWFQGPDGKWRFEIPDNQMTLTPQGSRIPPEGGIVGQGVLAPLERQIRHPQLFENYPELAKVPTIIQQPENVYPHGQYTGPQRFIPTGRPGAEGWGHGPPQPGKIEVYGRTFGEATPVMAHEIQHPIQGIEGFARGGNPSEFEWAANDVEKLIAAKTKELEAAALKAERARSPAKKEEHFDRFNKLLYERTPLYDYTKPYTFYQRLAGETEARATADRLGMTAETRALPENDPTVALRRTDPNRDPDRQPPLIFSEQDNRSRFQTGVPLLDALFKPGWR